MFQCMLTDCNKWHHSGENMLTVAEVVGVWGILHVRGTVIWELCIFILKL